MTPRPLSLLGKGSSDTSRRAPLDRIPLYAYLRLLFLLYLVLPQTQGARIIYTTYVHPYLEDNESQIEELIATAHDKMKAAGMAYLKRAIELLRTQVLGMAPSPEADAARAQSADDAVPASQRPRSYTQALLDRFQLPQGRWPSGGGAANLAPAFGGPGSAGQDFYNFLTSAVAAATGSGGGGKAAADADSADPKSASSLSQDASPSGVGAFPSGDLTASGTLVPPEIHGDAAKMTFLAAQRERLSLVLSALDREAAALRSAVVASNTNNNKDSLDENNRPATSASGKDGLSKSRSEADFEKIEAESDAEENPAQDSESARPTPAASGGSWMPWSWGGGRGRSSSSSSVAAAAAKEDKSKSE